MWDIRTWCEQFGIGVSTYHTLEAKPLSANIGRLVKIIESPGDYARRITERDAKNQARAA